MTERWISWGRGRLGCRQPCVICASRTNGPRPRSSRHRPHDRGRLVRWDRFSDVRECLAEVGLLSTTGPPGPLGSRPGSSGGCVLPRPAALPG